MKKTRKPVALLLSVLMLLMLFAPLGVVSFAQGDTAEAPEGDIVTIVETGDCGADGSDVKYTLYSDGTLTIEGSGEIRNAVFAHRQDLNTIVIKEGITAICEYAFASCSAETLIMPDSLKRVDSHAFFESDLTYVQFGIGLEVVGMGAFRACPTENIFLPESVKTIQLDGFSVNSSLTYDKREFMIVGKNVEYIGESAVNGGLGRLVLLNPDTEMHLKRSGFGIMMRPTIYGYTGGKVEQWVIEQNLLDQFVDLASLAEDTHDWEETGKMTKMPTCTAPGELTYFCATNPTHTYTEEIPMIPHKWAVETTEPTCAEAGSRVYTCALCGESYTVTIPATGHDWGDGVITAYPTETTPGEIVYTCALCGQENRVELPVALTVVESGNCGDENSNVYYTLYSDGTLVVSGDGAVKEKAFENREDITALWVTDGVTEIGESAFSDCHYMQTLSLADTVKALDDFAFLDCFRLSAVDFGNGLESLGEDSLRGFPLSGPIILPNSLKTIALQAFEYTNFKTIVFGTELEYADAGALYCTCVDRVALLNGNTVIGEKNQGDLTWMNAGYGPTVYSYAGGSVEENAILNDRTFVDLTAIEETDHNWSAGVVTTLPTCTETGVKTYVCLNNPTHTYTEVIPKIPHKWVLDSNTEPPTCDTAGSRVYSCALCDATHTETLPATGEHTYDDGVITVYPTETTDGEIRYTCTKCGDTYTDTVPATPYQDWLYTESYPTGNGQIGEHVYYTTYYDGHVSIYGEGETYPTSHYVPYDYYYHPIGGNPTSIEVHEGVTGLMCKGMFCNYPQLEYVKLPASLTYIESMVFDTIQVLTAVDVAAANPSYTSQNGILFNKDMTELLLYPSGKTENSYTVPDGVEIIGEMAFHKNPVLKTVTLPDSVKEIGNTAFNSSVLETVNLGNGLETIERFAFSNCKNLESIRIPTSVKFIGRGVFQFDDNFKNVYYDCTQAEWDAIEIGEWNEPLQEATKIFGGHSYDGGVITTPATCGADGVMTFTCVYCGGTRTETLPATGEHTFNAGVITIPATCEADGTKTFTCAGCGGSYTETIPATGHNWSDWIVTRPATETREGEAYRFCKNDPSHVEHMTIDKLPTTYEEEQSIGERIMDWLRDFFNKIGEFFQSLFIFW